MNKKQTTSPYATLILWLVASLVLSACAASEGTRKAAPATAAAGSGERPEGVTRITPENDPELYQALTTGADARKVWQIVAKRYGDTRISIVTTTEDGKKVYYLRRSAGAEGITPADRNRLLLRALQEGDVEALRRQLAAGADPNATDRFGATPLKTLFSAHTKIGNKADMAEALLKGGADPNVPDSYGNGALGTAIHMDGVSLAHKDRVFEILIRHGANPFQKSKHGNTAVHSLITSVMSWNKLDEQTVIRWLEILLKGQKDVSVGGQFDNTLLHHSVKDFHYRLSDFLLARGANINAVNKYGRTPLMEVVSGRSPSTRREDTMAAINYLVAKGADLHVVDHEGKGLLHHAAVFCDQPQDLDIIKLLLKVGVPLNTGDENGMTPTSEARQRVCKENHKYLAGLGGKMIVGAPPGNNLSAASQAVLKKDLAALATLPLDELQKIQSRSANGVPVTPLHLAVEQGDGTVLETLAKRQVDWNTGDQYGRTPLHHAVVAHDAALVAWLIDRQADVNREGKFGATPFSLAASGDGAIAQRMLAKHAPSDDLVITNAMLSGNDGLARELLPSSTRSPDLIKQAVAAQRGALADFLADAISVSAEKQKEIDEQRVNWKKDAERYAQSRASAVIPRSGAGPLSGKRGKFEYIVPSWSPALAERPARELTKYPVAIYVPKHYDAQKPFGLMLFMHGRLRAPGYPNKGYADVMDKKNMIWVAYSAYNGLYEPFKNYHEAFNLSVLHHLRQQFNIDPKRIYLGGLSWGGRLTCQILSQSPHVFRGGIAMGGCANYRMTTSTMEMARTARLALTTADQDFNRKEAFAAYNFFSRFGMRGLTFLQEPERGHTYLTAGNFERMVEFIDRSR